MTEKIMYAVSESAEKFTPPLEYRYETEKMAREAAERFAEKTGEKYYIFEVCITWERIGEQT